MRPPAPGARRTCVTRRIAADPTSTALLLADPAALELWPGLRRLGVADGAILVEAERPHAGPASALVQVQPPRRTPMSYVTAFDWVGDDVSHTAGELTLGYAPGGDGGPSTAAVLTLDTDGPGRDLEPLAAAFLANLAQAAESRSRAA